MKVRILILAVGFILGVLFSSCGASSKTCPAYSDASKDLQEEVNS
jgi:hypothetical protein